jgi:septum formation protein
VRAVGERPSAAVLGADTAVVLRSRILGKPASQQQAMDMLVRLSGQTHQVLTGVALRAGGELHTALSTSTLRFREIASAELSAYCRSGEFEGKAGAYAIQGLGGLFVESLSGSYSGVVGLPVFETAGLLRAAGMDIFRMTTLAGPAT